MNKGLSKTLNLLTKTKNEAAVGILIPALDSARVEVQEGALQALLDRHSDAGQREIVRRLHQINDRWVAIIDQRHGRMTNALRDAVLATDPQLCANGCRAVLWFHEYDLLPALVNAAEEESNPNRQLVSTTLLRLAELLYDELASPRDYRNRRDPQLVRQHLLASLENSVRRYPKHRVGAVIEAFLLLAHHDNATLKQILADPLNPTYRPVIELMTQSPRAGVIRLVLNFLDDPQAPTSAITRAGPSVRRPVRRMPGPQDRRRAVGRGGWESEEDRKHFLGAKRSRLAGDIWTAKPRPGSCNWPCAAASAAGPCSRRSSFCCKKEATAAAGPLPPRSPNSTGPRPTPFACGGSADPDPEVQANAARQLRCARRSRGADAAGRSDGKPARRRPPGGAGKPGRIHV